MQSTSMDPSHSVRFSEPEETGESATYRSLSAFAVIGLIISLLTVALVAVTRSPIPAVFAFVSAAVCFFGLRQTLLQSDVYGGKGLALAGLTISCLTAAWGVAYGVSRESVRQEQATAFVDNFLFCLAHDRVNEAYQFYDERFDGKDRKTTLAEYFRSDPDLVKARDGFATMPPLGAILDAVRAGKKIKYSQLSIAKEKGKDKTENYRTIWKVEVPSDREGGYPVLIYASFFVECEVKPTSTRWRLAQIVEAPADIRWKQ